MAIRKASVDLPREEWEKVIAVNMTGVFLCSRIAARHMIARGKGGAIVNTASIMGLSGGGLYPNISYQTSKGAVVNMTRALAVEWASHNIRVNAVAPTYVTTPFIAPLLAQPELIARIKAMTPLGRLAEPEEVALAILFLASPAAGMITGHTLGRRWRVSRAIAIVGSDKGEDEHAGFRDRRQPCAFGGPEAVRLCLDEERAVAQPASVAR